MSQPARRGEFITRQLNGGLNYNMRYGLTSSELRDGADFDVNESGSIGSRRAFQPFITADITQPVVSSWTWQTPLGFDCLFVQVADQTTHICVAPATVFTPSPFGVMVGPVWAHAWAAGGLLYVSDGLKVLEWDGVAPAATDVTTTSTHPLAITPVVTNLGVPANGTATTYRDVVFIGNVTVAGEDPDAIWWSAAVAEQPAGDPLAGQIAGQKDFYEKQRITFISGDGGSKISRLVAAGPNLYAFKRNSIHALSTSGTTVYTNDLATNLGISGPNAVAVHNSTVWFFDANQGLHVIEGGGAPQRVFDPIFPLLDCGRIDKNYLLLAAVGYDQGRVFISLAMDGAPANNVTFVLNTNVSSSSKGGAWSKWNVGFSSFQRWQPGNGDSTMIGFTNGPYAAVKVNECSDSIEDDYGFTTRHIDTWFRTALFDDGLPTLSKRWGKVAMTVSGTGLTALSARATVDVQPALGPVTCELPTFTRAHLVECDPVLIDIDLAPSECDDPCDEDTVTICDTDSKGEIQYNGIVLCGDRAVDEPALRRAGRIVSPGTGVAFSLEIYERASEKAWEIQELDVKYSVIERNC